MNFPQPLLLFSVVRSLTGKIMLGRLVCKNPAQIILRFSRGELFPLEKRPFREAVVVVAKALLLVDGIEFDRFRWCLLVVEVWLRLFGCLVGAELRILRIELALLLLLVDGHLVDLVKIGQKLLSALFRGRGILRFNGRLEKVQVVAAVVVLQSELAQVFLGEQQRLLLGLKVKFNRETILIKNGTLWTSLLLLLLQLEQLALLQPVLESL